MQPLLAHHGREAHGAAGIHGHAAGGGIQAVGQYVALRVAGQQLVGVAVAQGHHRSRCAGDLGRQVAGLFHYGQGEALNSAATTPVVGLEGNRVVAQLAVAGHPVHHAGVGVDAKPGGAFHHGVNNGVAIRVCGLQAVFVTGT